MESPVSELGSSQDRGRSFTTVVGGRQVDDDLPFRELTVKNGRPVLIFSSVEIARISAPYKTALIFKFYAQHLPISEIQGGLSNWGVHGGANFSVIDHRNVLINFNVVVDFMKVYTREHWLLKGQTVKVFRWSLWFRPGMESEVSSVWILLPALP